MKRLPDSALVLLTAMRPAQPASLGGDHARHHARIASAPTVGEARQHPASTGSCDGVLFEDAIPGAVDAAGALRCSPASCPGTRRPRNVGTLAARTPTLARPPRARAIGPRVRRPPCSPVSRAVARFDIRRSHFVEQRGRASPPQGRRSRIARSVGQRDGQLAVLRVAAFLRCARAL
jgi:hypothetical protein